MRRFRLWPEERAALVYFTAVLLLLVARGYPPTILPLLASYAGFVLSIAALVLPAWLVAQLWRWRRGCFAPAAARADLATFARALAPFLLVLVAYTNLKSRLLLFNPRLFDQVLGRLDDLLHAGGGDFIGWVVAWHAPRPTIVFHYLYFYAWVPFALPLAVAFARAGGIAARRTLGALGLCYLVGGFAYLALPSLGPALVEASRYAALDGTPAWATQRAMLEALRYIVEHPTAPAVPFFGLAAFPSLHLATTAVGLLVAWRWCRPLLWLLVPWNLAIAASAVYLGWHYVVDFYPALLLAWGAWWMAGRISGDDATPSQRSADPARAAPPDA